MPTDNHDLGKNAVGNTRPAMDNGEPSPGYETTDVNVGGIIVFLSGLAGFLLIFFVFCFVMGKVINHAFITEDGPVDKWHAEAGRTGRSGASVDIPNGKRENLANNPEMQQREYARMSDNFPNPRLQADDGNQATADLHAREDLLLDHYSTSSAENGQVRIPIDRAMALIAQRGLPVEPAAASSEPVFVGDAHPVVTAPLTSGFARTGYELDVIEARAQKMSYGKAEGAEHAELKPTR